MKGSLVLNSSLSLSDLGSFQQARPSGTASDSDVADPLLQPSGQWNWQLYILNSTGQRTSIHAASLCTLVVLVAVDQSHSGSGITKAAVTHPVPGLLQPIVGMCLGAWQPLVLAAGTATPLRVVYPILSHPLHFV